MNELLVLLVYLIDLSSLLVIYRYLGRIGCFAWIALVTLLANIQVVKVVEVFGVTSTLGNVAYATTFLATDILSENYGNKDARTGVIIGFLSTLVMMVLMTLTLSFRPSSVDRADVALRSLFVLVPRVALGSVLAYGASQLFDVWCYSRLKSGRWCGRFLWIRNNVSTILSQGIDTLVFSLVAFWGVYASNKFWEIVLTAYVLKIAVALMDTPFIYMARWLFQQRKVCER